MYKVRRFAPKQILRLPWRMSRDSKREPRSISSVPQRDALSSLLSQTDWCVFILRVTESKSPPPPLSLHFSSWHFQSSLWSTPKKFITILSTQICINNPGLRTYLKSMRCSWKKNADIPSPGIVVWTENDYCVASQGRYICPWGRQGRTPSPWFHLCFVITNRVLRQQYGRLRH